MVRRCGFPVFRLNRPGAVAVSFCLALTGFMFSAIVVADHGNEYDTSGPYSRTLHPGPFQALAWDSTNLTSEIDGENIHVAWIRPDTAEQVPIILIAGPYFGTSIPNSQTDIPFLVENFVQHGFAVGGIAVRGSSYSGGCVEYYGPWETADASQAVSWFGTQSWSNGNVAMYGSSYEGTTPWAVAGTGNPYLKAIVPMNGIPAAHDLMFRNGTAHSANGPAITTVYFAGHLARPLLYGMEPTMQIEAAQDATMCPDPYQGLLFSQHATLTGEQDPLGYWAARDHRQRIIDNYGGAIFSVMGLEDWNVNPHVAIPFSQQAADAGIDVRQLHHKAGHFWPDSSSDPSITRWDWAEMLLHWFGEHLRDGPVAPGNIAEVQSPDGRWWALGSYPPADAKRTKWHLTLDGISTQPGAEGITPLTAQGWNGNRLTRFVSPGGLQPVPGSHYQADLAFDEPTFVSGLPRLHATVTPTGPGGHVAAWLFEVGPDGSEERLGWAQMDLAFADGGTERKPVVPGQPILARMEFEPVHFQVQPDHTLRLRVWQFSAAENLPGLVATPILLHHGVETPSILDLPIIETPADFVPPVQTSSERHEVASYNTLGIDGLEGLVGASTVTFAVHPDEHQVAIRIRDIGADYAYEAFHACDDSNGDGECGGPDEAEIFGCSHGSLPLNGGGIVRVTVYLTSDLGPDADYGYCDNIINAPTQTVAGEVEATFFR